MNILRRLPLSRLLLLCALVVAIGVSITALALALDAGPTPPPKPLADAVHDALAAPPVQGVSARIQYTNHLLEGASLAGASGTTGQLLSSPLLTGASGRLWVGSDGHARLELQSEGGDTQVFTDGHSVEVYDASTNTLYRYTPPQHAGGASAEAEAEPPAGANGAGAGAHHVPSAAEIQEGIERLAKHALVSAATPTDVAGQAAYTVRVSPRENGGLIAGAELSWDAVHGVPLRAAIYSTSSSAPVIELAATEISYGPVASSTLDFTPPADAHVQEVKPPQQPGSGGPSASSGSGNPSAGGGSAPTGSSSTADSGKPTVTRHGDGLAAIAVVESPVKAGSKEQLAAQLESLPKVDINGTSASELPTALGTVLTFERAGVRYLLAGAVTPSAIEAFARGL